MSVNVFFMGQPGRRTILDRGVQSDLIFFPEFPAVSSAGQEWKLDISPEITH